MMIVVINIINLIHTKILLKLSIYLIHTLYLFFIKFDFIFVIIDIFYAYFAKIIFKGKHWRFIYFEEESFVRMCEYVCVFVCLSVCLSICQ